MTIGLIAFPVAFPSLGHAQTEAPEVPPEARAEIPAVEDQVPPPATPRNPERPAAPPIAVEPAPAPRPDGEPLAGFVDGTAFVRSRDGRFVLFPAGQVVLDGYVFHTDNTAPHDTFILRRARLEATGWVGGWAYFSIAGEYAAPPPSPAAPSSSRSSLAATDDYVALAPWGDLVALQAGQFDAPFTLENRTADKYLDFMERSMTVRAFGIPDNKQIGAMLHGFNQDRNFLYSFGVFNGDGPGLKNADDQFDSMARAFIAPFSFARSGPLHDVEIGASAWLGDRANTLAPAAQTTQGGLPFLVFAPFEASTGGAAATPVQLRQVGLLRAFAGEINAPVAHRFGLRGELVWRHSPLSEEDVTNPASPVILGGANLVGWSAYAEAWVWALGDDRIVGDRQGLEPFNRYGRLDGAASTRDGVMIAVRVERLDEEIRDEADAAALNLGDSAVGRTEVTSFAFGFNYWHGRHLRATFNYLFNRFAGDTGQIKNLESRNEQEFAVRLGVAL